ncbi:MAG TPA: hypothetical protein VG144_02345 [Gaiellaceae bacterium]|nr:hypothetical protein [Gaiellaceae bacterium]
MPAPATARGRLFAAVDAAAALLLAGVVGLSFAVRLVTGWLRATPNYFSDEYLYAELSRSLLESGRPLVRGTEVMFPALLQPLLTAPAWLANDVWLSYRLIQGLGALAMSLAALPVFFLARRLGTSRPLALGAAAFAVTIPDLLFASWVTAEPFAYPLLLAAVLGATAALDRPGRRHAALFLVAAGLATFARVQFAVLPICFLAAVLIVGLRERRVRGALREQALVLGAFASAAVLAAAVGFSRVLGLYESALDQRATPLELVERVGINLLVLAYSSGWILLPGALLGFTLALARPRGRAELAFAAFALPLTVALLLEAGLVGAVEHAQERYVFYVLPVAALAFCLYATRGWPARTYHALVAAALLAASATVPLAGFSAAEGKAHSPLLLAAFRVEEWVGSPGNGSLILAAAAGVLLATAVLLSRSPRHAAAVALGLAIVATTGAWGAAVAFDTRNSDAVKRAFLPAEPSWVDRAGVDGVVLVRGPNGVKTEALEQLFWNRSVDRVALLPGAEQVDHVHAPPLSVRGDGALLLAGRPVLRPLLIDGYAGTIRLANAELLGSSPSFKLWRPRGEARLSLYLAGRYSDGWLAGAGRLYLWPQRASGRIAGSVRLPLRAPAESALTLRFRPAGGRDVVVHLRRGERRTATFPVCSRGPWHLTFLSQDRGFVGGRIVSAHAGEPQLVPGPCRRSASRVSSETA